MPLKRQLTFTLFIFVASMTANASSDWKSALKAQLAEQFGLTKTGFGDASRITSPGSIYVIEVDGVSSQPTLVPGWPMTTVDHGVPRQPKGASALFVTTESTKQAKIGDRYYITSIDVKDDGVYFRIDSVDTSEFTYHGTTKQTRYQGEVFFSFDKASLPTATPDDVHKVVDPIFRSEADVKSAPVATVQLGQSPDQVLQALGKPDKIVDLGSKKVFIYKDMKVVFVDGKVSDVQ